MKGLAVALSIILLLTFLVTANAILLCRALDSLAAQIEAIELDARDFEAAFGKFEKMRWLLILTVRDDIRLDISNAFGDCISYAAMREENELAAAKSRLLHTIREVRRLSAFSLDAIF